MGPRVSDWREGGDVLNMGVTELDAELTRLELGFRNSSCLCSGHEYVNLIRDILGQANTSNLVKEATIEGETGN